MTITNYSITIILNQFIHYILDIKSMFVEIGSNTSKIRPLFSLKRYISNYFILKIKTASLINQLI